MRATIENAVRAKATVGMLIRSLTGIEQMVSMASWMEERVELRALTRAAAMGL